MIKNYSILIFLFFLVGRLLSQDFLNTDLDGIISGSSSLPFNWENVPFDDVTCTAELANGATPDLTDLFGPESITGVLGNPYSGNTFVSGVVADSFQEGIMQTVSGFNPNTTYSINFQQSVVKQINGLDQSGSWAVYIDTLLAGISMPTFSDVPFNSIAFIWEERSITFTATSTTHTIKLLPMDDDSNSVPSTTDITGALRMGIDSIFISSCNFEIGLGEDETICVGEHLMLDASISNASYLWQDSSSNATLNISEKGSYWVAVTFENCTLIDSIHISEEECQLIPSLPTIFTPNGDGMNDRLVPIDNKGITTINTIIFNRWGKKVYETNNPLIEWDGRINGDDASEGVYFWVISYTDIYGVAKQVKGSVTLVR